MKANPILIVVAAVAALVGGIIALISNADAVIETLRGWGESFTFLKIPIDATIKVIEDLVKVWKWAQEFVMGDDWMKEQAEKQSKALLANQAITQAEILKKTGEQLEARMKAERQGEEEILEMKLGFATATLNNMLVAYGEQSDEYKKAETELIEVQSSMDELKLKKQQEYLDKKSKQSQDAQDAQVEQIQIEEDEEEDLPGFDADKILKQEEEKQSLLAELRELSVVTLDEWEENEVIKEEERFNAEIKKLGDNYEAIETAKKVHKKKLLQIEESTLEKQEKIDAIQQDNTDTGLKSVALATSQMAGLFEKGTVEHKAFAIANIGVNTAMAIIAALAPPPAGFGPVWGVVPSIAIGAAGAASALKVATYEKGGVLQGPSHAQGGILTPFGELEGGEGVINNVSMSNSSLRNLASLANTAGGGNDFSTGDGKIGLDEGTLDALASRINDKQVIVSETDITETQNRVKVIEDEAYL